MADAVTRLDDLLAMLGLDATAPAYEPADGTGNELGADVAAVAAFRLKVPRPFIARMRHGDPSDPLLRQVLPVSRELEPTPGFVTDPVGDGAARVAPGLIHKYRGRALLITAPSCAVNCRYCFRRHYPYAETADLDSALAALANLSDVREVILSGGDPLVHGDEHLGELVERLANIPHLVRLRVHSRTPVVLPSRVTSEMLDWLTGTRLQPVLVVHINHPREVDAALADALQQVHAAGVTLLNQSVLLHGVNDCAEDLTALSEMLFANHVLPYYLNLLDPVAGAAHFAVAHEKALQLHAEMSATLPGYLVPRLVAEVPGAASKRPVHA